MPILGAEHDRAHAIGSDPDWSESYYFNGYASASDIGLFARIGIRPNAGTIRGFLLTWLPDGRLVQLDAEQPRSGPADGDLSVGGIHARCLAPMTVWRLNVAGRSTEGDEVTLEATFDTLTPAVGVEAAGQSSDPTRNTVVSSLATGHFEQAGRWRGRIRVGERAWDFQGYGNRDKSWGPRRTDSSRGLRMWRWFSINIDDNTHLGGIRVGTEAGELHRGWLWCNGEMRSLRRWDMRTRLAADGLTPEEISLTVTDKMGERHELAGEVMRVAPFPVLEMYGTHVLEGLTRWHYQDRTGYGIAEYGHVLDAHGRPLCPAD